MGSTGIVRRMDELGRVVIPKEIRISKDIKTNDTLAFFTEEDMIILTTYNPSCIFCGEIKGVLTYKSKKICPNCFNDLSK